ncbi:MAG TPA: TonB-dependent siderophore myxochelin receptor MxcH, partial [Polyangiaceae bacterium]|nr:TonB-dependent siderophore myxochelin receptor MxcH [Polyangiaceae bacterium]
PASPPRVVPPRLLELVEAEYPPNVSERVERAVVLALLIDAAGTVTSAEIAESAGPELDAAAQRAALGFRFAPATKDGRAVPARIRYVYTFRPPAEPAASESTAPLAVVAAAAPAAAGPSAAAASLPPASVASDAGPAPVLTPAPSPAADGASLQVTVRGATVADRLRESSRAVNVIDTERAQRHSGDVARVLARSEGVAVQRSGALGASSRLSLHGLTDEQVRVFVDGVPIEVSGFGFGLTSVPINWVERIDVYRGVVPVRLGTDALGGAIDLITERNERHPELSLSMTAGSFDTQQLSFSARTHDAETGFVARAAAFYDHSDNDYLVDVRVPNELGQLEPARVRRFHDGYTGGGALVEAGWIDRPWARRLSLRLYATDFDKDIQHNADMSTPYGAVTQGQTAFGGHLRYDQPNLTSSGLGTSLVLGYGLRRIDFEDVSPSVYDWYGRRVFERNPGTGELSNFASDVTQWEHRIIGRAALSQRLGSTQRLELVASPDFTTRSGSERLRVREDRIDPLTTRRDLGQLVTGLEHLWRPEGDRIENSLFAKYYLYSLSTDQVETFDNSIQHVEDVTQRFGAGDGFRVRLAEGLLAKASYEYATRLPRPDEVFGDGALITANLELEPETSHNGNLSLRVERDGSPLGQLSFEAAGFWRQTSGMIVRLPSPDRVHSVHQNVFSVRVVGVDGQLAWVAPGEIFRLEGNATLQDQRNVSDQGPFATFEGQRVPNRPWLFANGTATLSAHSLATAGDELSLSWASHFVGEFRPGWEDAAAADARDQIPSQLLHDLAIGYSVSGPYDIHATLDLLNVADSAAYDVLGVQKPGRAAFFKLTACWACSR